MTQLELGVRKAITTRLAMQMAVPRKRAFLRPNML